MSQWRLFPASVFGAVVAAAVAAVGCSSSTPVPEKAAMTPNPLLTPSTLPFQAPPWDKIKSTDFAPAFDEALAQHDKEIAAIAADPAEPTFDNVLVALEKSGQTLTRVQLDFNVV